MNTEKTGKPHGIMSFGIPKEDSPLDAPPLPGNCGILVVDEDPAFQLGLKTFLREYVGFERVFTARSGQEALDFIRSEPSIEVVTLDYRMPGMSGIEVLQVLREATPRPLGVLMITGYPSDELESEFHSMGTDNLLTTHFLSKPVEFEKLEHIVLAAHDEVIEAKHRKHREQEEPAADLFEAADSGIPAEQIIRQLGLQTARIEEMDREIKAQRGKWRADFWKVAFLLFAFWIASQFGLIGKIEPHWESLKADLVKSFSVPGKAAQPDSSVEKRGNAETPEEEAPSPVTSPPGERGQPL